MVSSDRWKRKPGKNKEWKSSWENAARGRKSDMAFLSVSLGNWRDLIKISPGINVLENFLSWNKDASRVRLSAFRNGWSPVLKGRGMYPAGTWAWECIRWLRGEGAAGTIMLPLMETLGSFAIELDLHMSHTQPIHSQASVCEESKPVHIYLHKDVQYSFIHNSSNPEAAKCPRIKKRMWSIKRLE